MDHSTFVRQLEQRFEAMTTDEMLRFGLEICRRLYPDYAAFSQDHKWGNADLLLDAIVTCEQTLVSAPDPDRILDLLRRIDPVIPDTEEFGDNDGSYALNAGAAVAYVLQFVHDGSPEHIKNAAIHYYDNMHTKLQEPGISKDAELLRHPRMAETRRFLLGE